MQLQQPASLTSLHQQAPQKGDDGQEPESRLPEELAGRSPVFLSVAQWRWLDKDEAERSGLPKIGTRDVHCAQVMAHAQCKLDGLPIKPGKSIRQHPCRGGRGNYLHGFCGSVDGDNEQNLRREDCQSSLHMSSQ